MRGEPSRGEIRRRAALAVVKRGNGVGVTTEDIIRVTGMSGYPLTHALWGLLRRGEIRVEWQRVKGKGRRFAILEGRQP